MFSLSSLQSSTTSTSTLCSASRRHIPLHRRFSLCPPPPPPACIHRRHFLKVHAMDAAQPYDDEALISTRFRKSSKLKIAVIGFGKFGQFLAKALVRQGHAVLAQSRSDYSHVAANLGVSFFSNVDDICEEHPEVILLCTSIISTESVLRSLPLQRLKRSTLFVDVLSVKEFPRNLFMQILPVDFDIICTHPMFGPESGKNGWDGLPLVYDKVRIGNDEARVSRCERFIDILAKEGCRMVEMSCAEHDRHAAGSQFITHTMGRILEKLRLESTPISTKGYETLLNLVENTASDSFDLYYGLFMYNKNAMEQLERLDLAFEALKKELFGHLHEILRKQLFGKSEGLALPEGRRVLSKLPPNGSELPQLPSPPNINHHHRGRIKVGTIDRSSKLKIGVIGFGNFGQFLSKALVRQGHTILAYSRSDYSHVAAKLGVSFFSNTDDICEEHPDVILICTSIMSMEEVLRSLPLQRLKRSTLLVDVLSVKEFPRNLFMQILPSDFDILCAHPMFGPESGKDGWYGLPFVYDKVRIGNHEARISRCERFLDIFAKEGCRMVEMSCAEHDRHAAESQFITHTIGRILEKLRLEATPINTKGYETLLNLVENTASDSFDLYYGLFMYNRNAMEQLERLDLAFESLKKELFGHLHEILRKQLFGKAEGLALPEGRRVLSKLPRNGAALPPLSEPVRAPETVRAQNN